MPVITKKEETKNYRVRDGLVVRLTDEKTYTPGEALEMTEAQFKRHQHQVETEEQYQARVNPINTETKGSKK